MKTVLKQIFFSILKILELPFSILTLISLIWLRILKKIQWKYGFTKLPLTSRLYKATKVLPVVDSYYDPLVNFSTTLKRADLKLEFRLDEQISFLKQLKFSNELKQIPSTSTNNNKFYYQNGSFEFGDAEILYSLVRLLKPKRIIEIGGGYSTLMTLQALEANRMELSSYECDFKCIEPYEQKWLKELPINLIRKRVEDIQPEFFKHISENDILFIDSSHIIRPQGDVLYEILHILPLINKGVIVHFHDIFTPDHYPAEWVNSEFRLWNEQYLLEAFLMFNDSFRILCSLNYLHKLHRPELYQACPMLAANKNSQPGSFWIKKIK